MKKLLLIALCALTTQTQAMFVHAARMGAKIARPAVRTLATQAPQKAGQNDTIKAMLAGGIATFIYLSRKSVRPLAPRV